MGVLIDRASDKEIFEKAVNEVLSIIQSSEQIALRKSERPLHNKKHSNVDKGKYKKIIRGYCIRCETRIDYEPSRPYCSDCYSVWAQFENYDYQENVCHCCGEYEETTMNKPQCYKCYVEHQRELAKAF